MIIKKKKMFWKLSINRGNSLQTQILFSFFHTYQDLEMTKLTLGTQEAGIKVELSIAWTVFK